MFKADRVFLLNWKFNFNCLNSFQLLEEFFFFKNSTLQAYKRKLNSGEWTVGADSVPCLSVQLNLFGQQLDSTGRISKQIHIIGLLAVHTKHWTALAEC